MIIYHVKTIFYDQVCLLLLLFTEWFVLFLWLINQQTL